MGRGAAVVKHSADSLSWSRIFSMCALLKHFKAIFSPILKGVKYLRVPETHHSQPILVNFLPIFHFFLPAFKVWGWELRKLHISRRKACILFFFNVVYTPLTIARVPHIPLVLIVHLWRQAAITLGSGLITDMPHTHLVDDQKSVFVFCSHYNSHGWLFIGVQWKNFRCSVNKLGMWN